MAPPTDCVSPIGEDLIRKGLQKEIGEADFFVSRTRTRPSTAATRSRSRWAARSAARCRPRSPRA
jgi:hypothetical protein